jgi:hypothetical protein
MLKCPFARNSGNHLPNILYRYPIPTLQQQHQVVYIKYCTLSQISQRIGNTLKTKNMGQMLVKKLLLSVGNLFMRLSTAYRYWPEGIG